jgi:predicted aspartyl protease
MPVTGIDGTATSDGKQFSLRFLVDNGATYTLLPEQPWKTLGLKPKRTVNFSLADGTLIERDVSECHLELPQGEGHTPVALGRPGDELLLGLVLNPFNRTLQPMRVLLP